MDELDETFEHACRDAGLSHDELWLRYFALGGMRTAFEVEAILYGALRPTTHDRDLIAVALNERFSELGANHPIPFTDDEPGPGAEPLNRPPDRAGSQTARGTTPPCQPNRDKNHRRRKRASRTKKDTLMNASSTASAETLVDSGAVPAPARAPMKAPSARLAALEMRASFEFMAFMASSSMLYLMRPGDGHPVMVLPPFIADDAYTAPLRWVLDGQGYSVHGWRQGSNLSRTAKIVEGLPRWLHELHEREGAKVSLIGHSGGGNWARDLAREYPFAVRQVITLGTPFRLRPGDETQADKLADMLLKDQVPEDPSALLDEEDRPPVPVPVTSIYSRTDGVAPWQAGLESEGPMRENIESGRQPLRPLLQPAGRVRRRRPPCPARRRMAAVPPAALHEAALPDARVLAACAPRA